MLLAPGLVARVAQESFEADPARVELVPRATFRDPLLTQIGLTLAEELLTAEPAGTVYAAVLAQSLAVQLLRWHTIFGAPAHEPDEGLSATLVRRTIDYIDANLATSLTLGELATVVNLSPYHFARMFARATGHGPHHFVIERRVEAAERLLADGTLSLKEIATQVGFADQSHLTRHFKRLRGLPPRAYFARRKNVQSERTNEQDNRTSNL